MWVSKLQSEIALSTLEAKYIAMSTAMRDLLPMRGLVKETSKKMRLNFNENSTVRSKVYEDNNGALGLATTPRITPRTKHIGIKYHHFKSKIGPEHGILIEKIDTTEQLADMFTKGLSFEQLEYLRNKLIGW